MRKKMAKWFRKKQVRNRTSQARRVQLEALETRRLLVGDIMSVVGDVNLDGVFDSSDFVRVFQTGKFETNEDATPLQGDWNGDGVFNSTDMVFAFQAGGYGLIDALSAEAEDDADEVGDDSMPNEVDDGEVDDVMDEEPERTHRQRMGRLARAVRQTIELLNESIESGNLPGDLTAEQAQQIADDLGEAIASADRDAIKTLVKQVRSEKQQDRIQAKIDSLTNGIAAGELPDGLTTEDAQTLVDQLTTALDNDDLNAAKELLRDARDLARNQDIHERGQHVDVDRIQARIDRLQAAVDLGELPHGLTIEAANELIAAYSTAIESGDLGPVMELKQELRVERMIDKLQAAIQAGELPGDLSAEEVQEIVATAQVALANGDLEAARDTLLQLRGDRTSHRRFEASGRFGARTWNRER